MILMGIAGGGGGLLLLFHEDDNDINDEKDNDNNGDVNYLMILMELSEGGTPSQAS